MSDDRPTTEVCAGNNGGAPAGGAVQSCPAACNIVRVQYRVNGVWKDVPRPLGPLCVGSSVAFKAITSPAGTPTWGGDASGTGAEKTVTFDRSGSRTVSVECGNRLDIPVQVADANATVTILWAHGYTSDNAGGDATNVERAFVATYRGCANIARNEWHLRVDSISGGTDMAVHMRSFSTPNPSVNITTQAQGGAAINDMLLEGDAAGPATMWVTEAAIRAHEEWHRDEWVETAEHYWPDTEVALKTITVPYDSHENDLVGAIAAMRAGAGGADAKIAAYKQICRAYWFTLGDDPGDRPYRAGGVVLNAHIASVRAYGVAQTPPWVLPGGTNPAPAADYCYQPWLPYAP